MDALAEWAAIAGVLTHRDHAEYDRHVDRLVAALCGISAEAREEINNALEKT